jgi:putative Flp pilus-assembly TadE/G-like protein
MIFMVAMAAIAIDVVMLYVVRSEAQRAADAAALAGAHQFVTSGFTSGLVGNSTLCDGAGTGLAEQTAIAVAARNNVGGQPGLVNPSDVQCDFTRTKVMGPGNTQVVVNPSITVKVTRQNLPTFFSRIWGSRTISSVSATATAEAFNESGSAKPTVSSCLKPFLLPNVDPNPSSPHFGLPLVDPTNNGNLKWPGYYQNGGSIGEQIAIAPAADPSNPQPGEFDQLLFTSTPSSCSCSTQPYEANIACCNPQALQCGVSTYQVNSLTPDAGQTHAGTQCLIHATGGADTIIIDPPPFQFIAGSGNPTGLGQGTAITTSDSLVTVPLFNPPMPPSLSVQPTGFLQLFIQSVEGNGTVHAVIVNVVGCSPNGSSGNAFISGGGISPVTVRLVQPGGGGN